MVIRIIKLEKHTVPRDNHWCHSSKVMLKKRRRGSVLSHSCYTKVNQTYLLNHDDALFTLYTYMNKMTKLDIFFGAGVDDHYDL